MKTKIGKCLLVINTALFIISLSVSFVILFRPFYYYHIRYLDIEKTSGYTYEEIKESYDDVIDYLTLNKEFKTGKLKYSEVGKDHFHDCKILFMINFVILLITVITLIIKRKYWKEIKIKNKNISFWSSILVITMFTIILIASFIIDFDKVFDIFHNIFFLGKDNWLLNPKTDEIIRILPQKYFMNCAILVLFLIFVISITIIIKEIYISKKTNTLQK